MRRVNMNEQENLHLLTSMGLSLGKLFVLPRFNPILQYQYVPQGVKVKVVSGSK